MREVKMDTEIVVIKKSAWDGLLRKIDELQEEIACSRLSEEASAYKKRALEVIEMEERNTRAVNLFPGMYSKEREGRKAHKKLFKRGILDADFSSTYIGYFKSKEMFGYFKLYGTNNVCAIPGKDYRDYADELLKKDFAFLDGHAFIR
jgi:hypothetical protein